MKTLQLSVPTVAVVCLFLAASAGAQVPQPPPGGAPPKTTTRGVAPPGQIATRPGLPIIQGPSIIQVQAPLRGFVDLHTHPLANIAFGGKLLYGGNDVNSFLPADPQCKPNVRAPDEAHALGAENAVHGGWGIDNGCGDNLRDSLIHIFQSALSAYDPSDSTYRSAGYPNFPTWPAWNDLTRQKMWVEWIRRAYSAGLRVMVALAVNNKLLADITRGPGDLPSDDKTTGDAQIGEIRAFVGRHTDFMEVALSSSDVYRIVSGNRLAVVIGVELDTIGNLTGAVPANSLIAEIDRLYGEGVRYIFPIHLTDNPIGGTAAYNPFFNVATKYETGNWWNVGCALPQDGINFGAPTPTPPFTVQQIPDLLTIAAFIARATEDITAKLGPAVVLNILPPPGPVACPAGMLGNVNQTGLTSAGALAIQHMMKRGMLIDIDHMSANSVRNTIALAQGVPGGYPLNSGHNGLRGFFGGETTERNFQPATYAAIAQLHGMAGVGSAKLDAYQWLQLYNAVVGAMGGPTTVAAGFGTDFNGLEFGIPPRTNFATYKYVNPNEAQLQACNSGCRSDCGTTPSGKPVTGCITACESGCAAQYPTSAICTSLCGVPPPSVQYGPAFPPSTDGNRTWNYNTEGVAHYGMLADFLQDVAALPGGAAMIQSNLMVGADYFFHTWQIAETQSAKLP